MEDGEIKANETYWIRAPNRSESKGFRKDLGPKTRQGFIMGSCLQALINKHKLTIIPGANKLELLNANAPDKTYVVAYTRHYAIRNSEIYKELAKISQLTANKSEAA